MRAPSRFLALLLALSSCKRAAPLPLDVPPEIDRLAVLVLDEAGAVVSASPLARWAPGAALPVVAGAGDVVLAGWRAADLDADGLPTERLGEREPLRQAAGCEEHLPAPAWAATWPADEAPRLRPAASLPALTAESLAELCPDLADVDLELDRRAEDRCDFTATRAGCTYDLDLERCALGHVTATVDRHGEVCLDLTTSPLACTRRPNDHTSPGPYTCTTPVVAELDAYLVPRTRTPPFDVAHSHVRSGTPYVPDSWGRPGDLDLRQLFAGWAHGLVVRDAGVFLSTSTEAIAPCEARSGEPISIRVLDPVHFLVRSEVEAGECADLLVADPAGEGVLGTFVDRDTSTWSLARYDADGARVATATSASPVPSGTPRRGLSATAIVAFGSPPEIAVLYTELGAEPSHPVVVLHDAGTLRRVGAVELGLPWHAYAMAPWVAGTILVGADEPRAVARVDPAAGVAAPYAFPNRLSLRTLIDLYADPRDGTVLALGQGGASLHVIRSGEDNLQRPAFEAAYVATTAARWPLDPSLVAVFGTTDPLVGEPEVYLSLFDPVALRYRPGSWPVGFGFATDAQVDGRGWLWALLPWTGEVMRIRPL